MNKPQTKRKILFIEESSELCDLARQVMKDDEYEVIGALGGKEGLKLVYEVRPDLALIDIMMPNLQGLDVPVQIRDDDAVAATPVILVFDRESDSFDHGVMAGHRDTSFDSLIKPVTPSVLIECITKVLNEEVSGRVFKSRI